MTASTNHSTRATRRLLTGLVGLGLALGSTVACASDDATDTPSPMDRPDCQEWLVRTVSAEELTGGCARLDATIASADSETCADGSVLWWTESAWGVVGATGRSLTATGAEDELDQARAACTP